MQTIQIELNTEIFVGLHDNLSCVACDRLAGNLFSHRLRTLFRQYQNEIRNQARDCTVHLHSGDAKGKPRRCRVPVDGYMSTLCGARCLQVLTGASKDTQAAEYRKFEEECIQAFNLIRKHSARLINLFQLVRSLRCFSQLRDAIHRHPYRASRLASDLSDCAQCAHNVATADVVDRNSGAATEGGHQLLARCATARLRRSGSRVLQGPDQNLRKNHAHAAE